MHSNTILPLEEDNLSITATLRLPKVAGLKVFILLCMLRWFQYLWYYCHYRETLLGQLLSYIKSLKEEFNNCSRRGRHAADGAAPPTGKNLPGVVNNIVWARQLQAKVSNFYLKALI